MRSAISLALVLAAAAAGCGTDSTVSGVFPAEGFTGRSMRVEISGDATTWSGSPGVNFGQGVTVSNVTVGSPTSLFADITIGADATPGTRDVTVTGGGTFTLKSSFELKSPIDLAFEGDVAQGGTPYFTITNHDFDTPFDLTQTNSPSGYNFTIDSPTGTNFIVSDATPYQLKGYALIDADAMGGPLSITSGNMDNQTAFNLGATVDVAARTPTPLTDMATGMLPKTGDSQLYSVNVTQAPALMRITAKTSSMSGKPVVATLPGGKWDNAGSAALSIANAAGSVDVVVFDAGTAGGYNFSLANKIELLTTAAEPTTSNDTPGTALNATALPFMQTGGKLTSATDKDVIKITLTAAAIVHVHAFAADDSTDTAVDILSSAAQNPTVLTNYPRTAGDPVDNGQCIQLFGIPCGEDVTSPMLAAGTYYVVISAGGSYDTSAQDYAATIYLN
jgi:hypothetical protein